MKRKKKEKPTASGREVLGLSELQKAIFQKKRFEDQRRRQRVWVLWALWI